MRPGSTSRSSLRPVSTGTSKQQGTEGDAVLPYSLKPGFLALPHGKAELHLLGWSQARVPPPLNPTPHGRILRPRGKGDTACLSPSWQVGR